MDDNAQPVTDRDERGRFRPGHSVRSPGRPTSEVSSKINAALEAAVGNGSLQKWAQAVKARVEKGDLEAAQFVFDRIIGKPVQALDIAGQVDIKLYEVVSPDDWPSE